MTIASEANRSGPYACDGVATSFPYSFKIYDEAHVRVILTDEAGVETTLALGADYAVTGVGADAGGAVETVLAHPVGCLVTLVLNVPFTQEIDLENQGAYFAETIERALDEGVQRDLQLAEEVARAFKLRASAELVAAGAVFVSDGAGGATGGPSASDIETAREIAVAAGGAATQAAATAGQKAQIAAAAAERAEAAATSVEGVVSYAVEQQLTAEEKARALENLGLDKALTPFGFTATDGQSAFDLGMSPSPNACIVSQNGAWLVGGVDYAIAGSTLTLATAAEAGDRISGVAISSFEVANVMLPAANLADLGDKAVARGNLGLGSAAVENAGTGAGQVLRLDAAGRIPAVDGSQLLNVPSAVKYGSVVNLTGAAVDLVGIPATVKKVMLFLSGAGVNNTSHIIVQLGTVGGVDASGYAGEGGLGYDYGAVLTNGMLAAWGGAAANWTHSDIEFRKATGNRWTGRMVGGVSNGGGSGFGISSACEKTLAGALDRVRITTVNGTDLLDAGTVTIWWE